MESLENKLDRLSPEQRREIEDFVDFLLSRPAETVAPVTAALTTPPVLTRALPPFIPEPVQETVTVPARFPDSVHPENRAESGNREEAETAPFHEIGGGMPDRLSHDYMDYGQFENRPSPVTEAVNKVKRKIIAREAQERPHHLLDWVD